MFLTGWLSSLKQRIQSSPSRGQFRRTRLRRRHETVQFGVAEVQVLETRSLLSSGTLNASFGAAGVQLVAAGTAEAGESARAMAITADGKIVIAGSATGGATGSDFALTELNADGSVNASFGAGGHVTLDVSGAQNDVINSVAIDASGRIVVAGTTSGPTGAHDAVVMRFNANGSVDTSFGAGGKVIFDFTGDVTQSSIANGVTINANAQIIVAGTAMIGQRDRAIPGHARFGIIIGVRPDCIDCAFLLNRVEQ